MAAFTSFDSSVKISKVELSAVQMRVAQVGQGPDIVCEGHWGHTVSDLSDDPDCYPDSSSSGYFG